MMTAEISDIRNAAIEPAAFTVGGMIHSFDATLEVNWRMLYDARVGWEWTGHAESQHRRTEEKATVVYRTEHTAVVLFETFHHADGEDYSNAQLQAFHFQDGVCVAATRRA